MISGGSKAVPQPLSAGGGIVVFQRTGLLLRLNPGRAFRALLLHFDRRKPHAGGNERDLVALGVVLRPAGRDAVGMEAVCPVKAPAVFGQQRHTMDLPVHDGQLPLQVKAEFGQLDGKFLRRVKMLLPSLFHGRKPALQRPKVNTFRREPAFFVPVELRPQTLGVVFLPVGYGQPCFFRRRGLFPRYELLQGSQIASFRAIPLLFAGIPFGAEGLCLPPGRVRDDQPRFFSSRSDPLRFVRGVGNAPVQNRRAPPLFVVRFAFRLEPVLALKAHQVFLDVFGITAGAEYL